MKSRHAFVRLTSGVLALVVLTAIGHSDHVVALGGQDPSVSAFCTSLSDRAKSQQERLDKRTTEVSAKREEQAKRLINLVDSHDKKVQDVRAKIDAQRAQNMEALDAKAKTEAQKSAVLAYAQALARAAQTRRDAVDAARATFRTAVKTNVDERQAVVAGQVQALRIAVADSYSAAQHSCELGTPVATTQQTLKQSLQAARQNYATQRKTDLNAPLELKQLADTRKAAVKAANDAFKASTQAARQALKQAFPEETN